MGEWALIVAKWRISAGRLPKEKPPRVLNGDDSLGGKVREQGNLLFRERSHLLAVDSNDAYQLLFFKHRDVEHSPITARAGGEAVRSISSGHCSNFRFTHLHFTALVTFLKLS